jgi:AraC-like DNA-binding protein
MFHALEDDQRVKRHHRSDGGQDDMFHNDSLFVVEIRLGRRRPRAFRRLPFAGRKLPYAQRPTGRPPQNAAIKSQPVQSVIDQVSFDYDVILKDASEAGFAGLGMFSPNGHRAEPRDIWSARKFIEEHASEPLSLRRVAGVAGINPTHLSEKFKQVTGIKFVDYIAQTRFEKARELLEGVDLRVSEIAFTVGFQSLSQFNRVFKKLSGKSPTDYRNSERLRQRRSRNGN